MYRSGDIESAMDDSALRSSQILYIAIVCDCACVCLFDQMEIHQHRYTDIRVRLLL